MKKVVFFLFLFLCGCNYRELNQISIVNLLTLDQEAESYILSGLVTEDESGELKFYQGKGKTMTIAFQNFEKKLKKTPYLSHLQAIIVNENIAKQGLKKSLNYFLNRDNIRDNFYLLLTEKKASDLLKKIQEENLEEDNLSNLVHNNKTDHPILNNTLNHFLKTYVNKGEDPVLNYINENLEIDQVGFFKDDQLKKKGNQNMELNLLLKNTPSIVLTTDQSSYYIKELTVKISLEGKTFTNTVTGVAKIAEGKKEENIDIYLKENLDRFLVFLKENKVDPIGYQKLYYQKKGTSISMEDLTIKNKVDIKINSIRGDQYE